MVTTGPLVSLLWAMCCLREKDPSDIQSLSQPAALVDCEEPQPFLRTFNVGDSKALLTSSDMVSVMRVV